LTSQGSGGNTLKKRPTASAGKDGGTSNVIMIEWYLKVQLHAAEPKKLLESDTPYIK
jgi:hypothetical protein